MNYNIRQAKANESRELAVLINHAGKSDRCQGLDLYAWSLLTEKGEDPYDVGAREISSLDSYYSYKNIRVIEVDGKIAALSMSFMVMAKTPEEMKEVPELSKVFKELTNTIDGCYYLDSLATHPDYRGMGLGSVILEDTINLAREGGFDAIYLLAFEENIPAISLYAKNDFYPARDLPVPDHPEMPYGGKVVLFKKEI